MKTIETVSAPSKLTTRIARPARGTSSRLRRLEKATPRRTPARDAKVEKNGRTYLKLTRQMMKCHTRIQTHRHASTVTPRRRGVDKMCFPRKRRKAATTARPVAASIQDS